jgi:transposase
MIRVFVNSIMNYFVHRINNAMVEGVDSRIVLIAKMAYGFKNKEHLKKAIYFRWGNLQLCP